MTKLQQKFNNFEKAYFLLSEVFISKNINEFSVLEQEGIIQRFEYTYELLWKVLKDFLEYENIAIDLPTPKQIIRLANSYQIFEKMRVEAHLFIEMLEARNFMIHTYDIDKFQDILLKIQNDFTPAIAKFYQFMKERINE